MKLLQIVKNFLLKLRCAFALPELGQQYELMSPRGYHMKDNEFCPVITSQRAPKRKCTLRRLGKIGSKQNRSHLQHCSLLVLIAAITRADYPIYAWNVGWHPYKAPNHEMWCKSRT